MGKKSTLKNKGHYKLRDIVDAILWVLRTGPQWRNLSECFPKWKSAHCHFRKWEQDGPLVGINTALNRIAKTSGKATDSRYASIDSQSLKSGIFTCWEKVLTETKRAMGANGM